MTQGKHTPGPWRVGKPGPNLCPTVGAEKGLMVAMVSYGDKHPTEANAHLIAAAPDMLEALRIAREAIVSLEWVHFNEIAGPGDTFDAWLSDNEALPVIDAAIAKATGESK